MNSGYFDGQVIFSVLSLSLSLSLSLPVSLSPVSLSIALTFSLWTCSDFYFTFMSSLWSVIEKVKYVFTFT
jgi:uncharacterized membrane protein (GlpM family)